MIDPNSISEEDAHLVQLYVDAIRGVNCGRRTGATLRMIDLYAHKLLMSGEVVVTCNYKPDPEENRREREYIYNAILKRMAHEHEDFIFDLDEETLTIKRSGFKGPKISPTSMWRPIDPLNLPEQEVFTARAALLGEEPVFAYGRIVFEQDVHKPYLRCFVAHCGGSYVVDYVTHYLDPKTILATN